MAGAGVEDDIGTACGEVGAGSVCDPCVLADLETDADARDVENEISYGDGGSVRCGEVIAHALRPWLEPAGLVVDPVAREVSLGGESDDPAVCDQGAGVEQGTLMEDGKADGDNDAFCFRDYHPEHFPRAGVGVRGEKPVLAAVACEAEFREADERGSVLAGCADGGGGACEIPRPVERGLVECGGGEAEVCHGNLEKGASSPFAEDWIVVRGGRRPKIAATSSGKVERCVAGRGKGRRQERSCSGARKEARWSGGFLRRLLPAECRMG